MEDKSGNDKTDPHCWGGTYLMNPSTFTYLYTTIHV